jgi:hypothetical protein
MQLTQEGEFEGFAVAVMRMPHTNSFAGNMKKLYKTREVDRGTIGPLTRPRR